jgi:methionyl-tRNA formyltransferase
VPAPVRATFLGNDPWSVPTLERLHDRPDVDVVLVVTNPPRPAGRGSNLTPTPVAVAAREMGLPLAEVARARDAVSPERMAALAADVTVVVAYGEILSVDELNAPRLGSVNLHLSRLPRWRGASPVQHAILAGDTVTGVTVIQMDEGMDTGPVLAQRPEPIRADDDAGMLGARLASIGAGVVAEVLPALATGEVAGVPQTGDVTFAPKFVRGDRVIDWHGSSEMIVRRIRAFAPDPGATTTFRGVVLKLLRAASADRASGDGAAGTVLAVERDGVVVAGGDGSVRVLEVAASGRRRMPAADWARGVRDVVGERLGS